MLFSGFLAFALTIASVPSAMAAKTFNAETFTLDNGLQVVVIPNHRAPVVSHMIWYKFGAADEEAGQSGIAHFLEHLMFKGTPLIPKGQFSLDIKKMGGDDNAFTGHDYTAYYQNVPRASLEKVMQMEADRMKNLELKPEEVASERNVIIEERRERIDNQPQARLSEQVMSALFVNHPYGTPVIGWLHEMEQLTQEEAYDYYNRWYSPNNAILVVAGDVTAAEVKPLARKYYGVIPPQMIPDRVRPQPAPIIAEHRIILQDSRVGPPVLMKFYRVPHGSEAMDVLAEILGGTSTSRLYRNLVVDKKAAITAGANYEPINFDDSVFMMYASPTPRMAIADLESVMDQEVANLLEKGITDEELKSAKSRKLATFTYYLDSLQGPAMLFGRALASGFSMDYVENEADRLEKITVADMNKAAQTVFNSSNLPITGILMPEPKLPATKGSRK